jgi:hypothetical protein
MDVGISVLLDYHIKYAVERKNTTRNAFLDSDWIMVLRLVSTQPNEYFKEMWEEQLKKYCDEAIMFTITTKYPKNRIRFGARLTKDITRDPGGPDWVTKCDGPTQNLIVSKIIYPFMLGKGCIDSIVKAREIIFLSLRSTIVETRPLEAVDVSNYLVDIEDNEIFLRTICSTLYIPSISYVISRYEMGRYTLDKFIGDDCISNLLEELSLEDLFIIHQNVGAIVVKRVFEKYSLTQQFRKKFGAFVALHFPQNIPLLVKIFHQIQCASKYFCTVVTNVLLTHLFNTTSYKEVYEVLNTIPAMDLNNIYTSLDGLFVKFIIGMITTEANIELMEKIMKIRPLDRWPFKMDIVVRKKMVSDIKTLLVLIKDEKKLFYHTHWVEYNINYHVDYLIHYYKSMVSSDLHEYTNKLEISGDISKFMATPSLCNALTSYIKEVVGFTPNLCKCGRTSLECIDRQWTVLYTIQWPPLSEGVGLLRTLWNTAVRNLIVGKFGMPRLEVKVEELVIQPNTSYESESIEDDGECLVGTWSDDDYDEDF